MEATQTKLTMLKKAREEEQTAPINSKPPRHWKSRDDKVKKEDKEIKNEYQPMHPDEIAKTYLQFYEQEKSSWASEIELRNYNEKF